MSAEPTNRRRTATLVAAARHGRPANWTPEDRDHQSR